MTTARRRRSRAPGQRLRTRLLVSIVMLTIALYSLTTWSASRLLQRELELRWSLELDRRLLDVESSLAALAEDVDSRLLRLIEHLTRDEPGLLLDLLVGEPDVADAARRLSLLGGLDRLEVIDGEGRIVSSSARPESAGLVIDELREMSGGMPGFRRLVEADSVTIVVQVKRPLEAADHRVQLIGSLRLAEGFLARIAAGQSALLIDVDGGLLASVGPARFDPVTLTAAWSPGRDGVVPPVVDDAGAPWTLGYRPLRSLDEKDVGRLVVGIDRRAGRLLAARLDRTFVALGGLAILLASIGGVWIARGTSRPLTELVAAVDSIGAGEADYTFTRAVEDEFEELITAFSRLHRSLELQRRRSRAAERVAAWREVARHVAHEVKNPLMPIRLTVENLQRAREHHPEKLDEMLGEATRTILEEVDRLRRMVGEFSEFARLPLPERRPTDIAALLDGVVALYSGQTGLEIHHAVEGPLPELEVDPDQISRALKNVVGNAVEAMAGNGASRRLELRAAADGEWITIEIADRGSGFTVDTAERIFEPYFTTKAEGTGLGMWITYRIITEHGGVISAENRPGGGARVVVRLPLATSGTA